MVAVVLFGAGASYGSKDVSPYPPPLGAGSEGLFARLVQQGGVASTLPAALQETFTRNFEEGMATYDRDSQGAVMTFQRELAGYLAHFTIGARNLYLDLLGRIHRQRVVFASLNYDLLFEQAAAAIGAPVIYSREGPPQRVRLLKPHGSSNFWPDAPARAITGVRFEGVGSIIEGDVRPLSQRSTLVRCSEEDSLAPAIALYAEGKPVQVCTEFVLDQQRQWADVVGAAHSMFVTGVRVNPKDAHIWEAIAMTKVPLFYFGLGSDREEFVAWKAQTGRARAYFVEGDFQVACNHIAASIG